MSSFLAPHVIKNPVPLVSLLLLPSIVNTLHAPLNSLLPHPSTIYSLLISFLTQCISLSVPLLITPICITCLLLLRYLTIPIISSLFPNNRSVLITRWFPVLRPILCIPITRSIHLPIRSPSPSTTSGPFPNPPRERSSTHRNPIHRPLITLLLSDSMQSGTTIRRISMVRDYLLIRWTKFSIQHFWTPLRPRLPRITKWSTLMTCVRRMEGPW